MRNVSNYTAAFCQMNSISLFYAFRLPKRSGYCSLMIKKKRKERKKKLVGAKTGTRIKMKLWKRHSSFRRKHWQKSFPFIRWNTAFSLIFPLKFFYMEHIWSFDCLNRTWLAVKLRGNSAAEKTPRSFLLWMQTIQVTVLIMVILSVLEWSWRNVSHFSDGLNGAISWISQIQLLSALTHYNSLLRNWIGQVKNPLLLNIRSWFFKTSRRWHQFSSWQNRCTVTEDE